MQPTKSTGLRRDHHNEHDGDAVGNVENQHETHADQNGASMLREALQTLAVLLVALPFVLLVDGVS